ncbi:MAG TPA: hypothetical protein DCO63_02940 [Streptococcus sp.]|nr:hypothetical protein [Streptococcus sp.]
MLHTRQSLQELKKRCKISENKNQHLDDREIMGFMISSDANVFMLGVVKNIDYNTKNVEKALSSLPYDRQREALKYAYNDCINSIIGYRLLEHLINDSLNIEKIPKISYTQYGKPYFKIKQGLRKLYFNISHTDGCVVVAVSNSKVGVDVETIRNMDLSIKEMFLSTKEIEKICSESWAAKSEATRIWTLKESYLKMKGTGLVDDLFNVDTAKLNLNSISINIQEYWISANILSGSPSCQLFIYEDKEFGEWF